MVVIGNYKIWTDNGGTSPSKKHTLYALVDPISPPVAPLLTSGAEMVEAPGTAPGSNGFITMAIYRHSRCRHG